MKGEMQVSHACMGDAVLKGFSFSQQPSLDRSGDASIVSLSSSWHSRFFVLSFLRGYGWLSCCDTGSWVVVVFVVDDNDAAAVWS